MVIALVSHLRGPGSGHEWVRLVVGSLLCSERFFSEVSGFTLSSRINISKFQFDRMQDLPVNHFRVSGASWVNINNSIQFKMAFELVQESLGKNFAFGGLVAIARVFLFQFGVLESLDDTIKGPPSLEKR